MTEHSHPFPGNVLLHVEQLDRATVDPTEVRTPVTDLAAAVLVSSEMADGSGNHRPVLDVDLPVTVLPSSTPGHCHLLIDAPMPWFRYAALLRALADAGLVERGYVKASVRRRCSGVRVPWIRKGDALPPLVPDQTPAEVAQTLADHGQTTEDPWGIAS